MKKRCLAFFLGLVLLVLNVLPVGAIELTDGNYTYYVNSDGTSITIASYNGSEKDVSVPSVIDGYIVTAIARHAFMNCWNMESIVIPDTVRSLGEAIFWNCSSLKSATFGYGIVEIKGYNGQYAYELLFDKIPEEIRGYTGSFIDFYVQRAFPYRDQPEFVSIGECPTVYDYEENSNYWNQDTGSVTITAIWGAQKNVVVPETINGLTVTIMEYNHWYSNENGYIETLVLPKTLEIIGSHAFYCYRNLKSVVIPEGVVSIGEASFYGCNALTEIIVPDSVKDIGHRAFCDCYQLKKIHLPETLERIGSAVFAATAYADDKNNWEFIFRDDNGWEYGYGGLYIDNYLVSFDSSENGKEDTYTVRSETIGIADWVFRTEVLKHIVFPETLHKINRDVMGYRSYYKDGAMESVTFLAGDVELAEDFFAYMQIGEICSYAGSEIENFATRQGIPFRDISNIKTSLDGSEGTMAPRYETSIAEVAKTLKAVLSDVVSVEGIAPDNTVIADDAQISGKDTCFLVTYANGKTAIYRFADIVSGDVNGDGYVDATDARWVLQAAAEIRTLTEAQKIAADVNGDASIDATDARWILQAAADLRTLPAA